MSACLSAYPACRSNGRTRARTAARGRTDGRGRADGRLSETQKSDERSIRGGGVEDEREQGLNVCARVTDILHLHYSLLP